MIATWPCPGPRGPVPELALICDRGRPRRLLIVPALFDEGNRLRRFTAQTMRELDALGIDCFLPDLPGSNESPEPLIDQTVTGWHTALTAAARHFAATRVLAIRSGALVAPDLPGWHYAPVTGSAVLRQMLRARILTAREAGREESQAELMETGARLGLELNGYPLGPAMIAGLQAAQPGSDRAVISQADIGGSGLWLRAEPDEAPDQSRALAGLIAGAEW